MSRPLSGVSATSITTESLGASIAASSSAAEASSKFRSAEVSATFAMPCVPSFPCIAAPMKPRAPSSTTRSGFRGSGFWWMIIPARLQLSVERVLRWRSLERLNIFPAPLDHFSETFIETDLRLPAGVPFDRGAVQPVLGILAGAPRSHFHEFVERQADNSSDALGELSN